MFESAAHLGDFTRTRIAPQQGSSCMMYTTRISVQESQWFVSDGDKKSRPDKGRTFFEDEGFVDTLFEREQVVETAVFPNSQRQISLTVETQDRSF
jgi:hypothetical protein